jgi:hypothetical protein
MQSSMIDVKAAAMVPAGGRGAAGAGRPRGDAGFASVLDRIGAADERDNAAPEAPERAKTPASNAGRPERPDRAERAEGRP